MSVNSRFEKSNPISGFKITLSKPCGNLKDNYNKREFRTSRIFTNADSCSYYNEDEELTQDHPLMRETGFSESEYDVLMDNRLLSIIKRKMPINEFNQT